MEQFYRQRIEDLDISWLSGADAEENGDVEMTLLGNPNFSSVRFWSSCDTKSIPPVTSR